MSLSKRASSESTAYVGLGSNLGDRRGRLAQALARLDRAPETKIIAASSVYATAPVGPVAQPEFLNAVAQVWTRLPPEDLLRVCLEIEAALGRVRTRRWGPRAIDLDLLAYDELSRADRRLALPHPRMTERGFVLFPLAELAPRLAIRGRTVGAWAAAVGTAGVRRLEGPKLWPPTS